MQLDSTIVALARCPGYGAGSLDTAIDTVLSAVDPPENLTSCHVLLKPNLISAKKGTLPCTEGAFLLAVAMWFLDRGAVVSVGDSPAFGTTTSVLARLEYADPLQKLGIRLVNFSRVRTVSLPSGIKAGMAADALDCDLLVNLPRVKAHAQLRVTLAVKNCFGCLAGLRKPWWHMMHGGKQGRFADLLVELLSILPDSLHLVDGIVAMHETGPMGGRAYKLGIIGGSNNPVALDTALLGILGVDPQTSPLWAASGKARLPAMSWPELSYPLLHVRELQVADFQVPSSLNPIPFNPFRFLSSSIKRMAFHRS